MNKALVVVDVQSYFLREAPHDLVPRIADYIKKNDYHLVVGTIFQGTPDSNYSKSLHWQSCQSPDDWVVPQELQLLIKPENFFTKTSYSAFINQDFCELLKQYDIEALDVCGLDLDGCVLATAYDAFDRGFDTKVLFEICHTRFSHRGTIEEIITRNIQSKNESR